MTGSCDAGDGKVLKYEHVAENKDHSIEGINNCANLSYGNLFYTPKSLSCCQKKILLIAKNEAMI